MMQASSGEVFRWSRLFVSVVEAGEAAGILDAVLDRVAYQIKKKTKIMRLAKGR